MSKERLGSWGVVWNDSIPYAVGHTCLDCGHRLFFDRPNLWNLVGFEFSGWHKDPIATSRWMCGKVIFQCIECSEKFWFHCDADFFNLLKRKGLWPGDKKEESTETG